MVAIMLLGCKQLYTQWVGEDVRTYIHTPHVSVNSSSQLQACQTINEAIHLEDIKAYLSIPTLR